VELSPERAIEIQTLLGADIIMQLDECIKLPNTAAGAEPAIAHVCAAEDSGGARQGDAAVARLGRARQARLRERAARPRAVWYCAGRRRSGVAGAERARADRDRLSGIRH